MTVPHFDILTEKELYANPQLVAYLTNVQRRHRYVRMPGLPNRKDRPDLPIALMFVPPLVSSRPISVDSDPADWLPQCEDIYAALERYRRVALLGDAGMGKTTLINRLAQDLTFAPSSGPLIDRFGWVLPVPMVLRELPLGAVTTFDGLLEAFLSQPVGEPLRDGDYLHSLLAQGRVLLMLDGIDELGSRDARLDLQSAVFDGMRRFPDCLWFLSSRIVGYGEVPYERQAKPVGRNGVTELDADLPAIGKRYIAPFDDRRARRFVFNWYRLRDRDAAGRVADLGDAIRRDKSLQRLARIPNVLALMALVHRNEATLPHERSVLYRRIAEAHLESTDKHRGISESTLDLPRKKMWLARVGFEMQRRREHDAESELVASCNEVQGWIQSELERSKAVVDVPTPAEFLSFLGRRSGLLIPRANDQYAFSHLSFQEYLAAEAIEREVTGFNWAKEGRSSLGFDRGDLAAWAQRPAWLETFCFLFEMLADRPEWHSALLSCVFGDDFSALHEMDASEGLFHLGHLAVRLVTNPYSGLGPHERQCAVDACVHTQIRCSAHHLEEPDEYDDYVTDSSLLTLLMNGDKASCDGVVVSLRRRWPVATRDLRRKVLDLRGAKVDDLAQLALPGLDTLILTDTDVERIDCIGKFKNLSWLELEGTPLLDISPITEARTLEFLNLGRTSVADIAPLTRLPALDAVLLFDTPTSSEAIDALQEALPNCDIVKDS